MGMLDRMFSSDPQKDLDRAAQQLEKGAVEKALSLASRALKKQPESTQAQALVAQVRDVQVRDYIYSADRCEASGCPEDAVEWLTRALDLVRDSGKRLELERRIEGLTEGDEEPAPVEPTQRSCLAPEEPEPAPQATDDEDRYQILLAMLTEEHARRIEDKPEVFRQAYLALNDGHVAQARDMFQSMLQEDDRDPVVLFEHARCLMIEGRVDEAAPELEAAWEGLGDADLDEAGTLSAPALWAEANLFLGREARVLERIEPMADPQNGREMLSLLYARALEQVGRPEDAISVLIRAKRAFPNQPLVPFMLAMLLDGLDETDDAIAVLEQAIAPSCSTGGCAAPPLHLPSMRLLIALVMKDEARLPRAEALFRQLGRAQAGRFTSDDLRLLARFHQARGDEDAAKKSLAEAEKLEAAGESTESVPATRIKAGDDALM